MAYADDESPLAQEALILWGLLVFVFFGTGAAHGQLISLKTAPVATGDQFQVFPAQNMGMGQLSIAVVDSTGDPFVNPAKSARLSGTWAFSTPLYYTITGNDGSAQTLPVGALFDRGSWFGGFNITMQQLMAAETRSPVGWRGGPTFMTIAPAPQPEPLLRDRSSNNHYASALVGRRMSPSLSVAGWVFWAGLEAVDGVHLLYPRSQRIDQGGHHLDVRLGLLGELEGHRSFEVLLLHHRADMTHDVTYVDTRWDKAREEWITQMSEERNLDRTNTWGLHSGTFIRLGRKDGVSGAF